MQTEGARVNGIDLPDLQVRPGEIVRVDGPNGAGKSTLLRALVGLGAPADRGRILLGGDDPRTWDARDIRRAVGFVPQDCADALVGLSLAGEARLRGQDLPPGLPGDRPVTELSAGQRRRALLHFAFTSDAQWLLLDEPLADLDEVGRADVKSRVQAAAVAGRSVLIVDQTGQISADRIVDLGDQAGSSPLGPRIGGADPIVLAADGSDGTTTHGIRLPALQLGAGFHVLRGPNGAGKTTWLHHLIRCATVDGQPLRPGSNAWVAPDGARDLFWHDRVGDSMPAGATEPFGVAALMDRHPWSISDGEARRCSLAATLGRQAPAYLLDEPDAGLDAAGMNAVAAALRDRAAAGACIVAASHDPRLHAIATSVIEVAT